MKCSPPRPRAFARTLAGLAALLLPAALWLAAGPRTPTATAQVPLTLFRNFESPQVHPLAVTPDGTRLLAVNSPNATLSVFQLTGGTPVLTAEIPVGLEPVSVAARNDREAWVVNWLSDSISVVDLSSGNVVRTVDVGDEPTDVLFAAGGRAFVCVSGGGSLNISGRAVTGASGAVKVFDADNPSAPPHVVEIFGKQPRALARNADGTQVFVSVFESGNQTTLVPERVVGQNGGLPPPSPAPAAGLPPAPNTGLVVRWNGAAWADETGDTKWDQFITYTLADIDLVTIDNAPTPSVRAQARGLGTHLGNMVFDAASGRLFVANLDSDSVRRFEPNLRGRFQSNRVSVLTTSGGAPALASAHDLNPHVDFSNPAGTDAERAQSLALPADMARGSDGTLYVAATGSAKVGFLDASGAVRGRIAVGRGPTGLALDEPRQRLYVLNRHDQTLSVVDTAAKAQLSQTPVGFNPEPAAVRDGRRFLYDAQTFSAHGTVSCASCHPGGHRDGLAWDLGDPTGSLVPLGGFTHHPMKGPMTTQSLRGLLGAGLLHWRADRLNVSEFNVAFTGLLGSTRLLTPNEMAAFTAFVNTLTYPPNPNENLDRTFPNPASGPNAQIGMDRFRSFRANLTPNSQFQNIFLGGVSNCNGCHTAVPTFPNAFNIGSARLLFPASILSEPRAFKVPQLRGIYQKAGMQKPAPGEPRTEQITGFGFTHDGSFDTLLNFMRQPNFVGFRNDDERRDIEAFLLSFDSVIAPAVGLQVTVNAENKNSPEVLARVNLLVQQAQLVPVPGPGGPIAFTTPSIDLIVRGLYGGRPRGFLQTGEGHFKPDSAAEGTVTLQQLLAAVGPGAELTFTGVPVAEGRRSFAVDRNFNNVPDDDEPRSSVSITGRVVNASGAGVAGVTVRLSGAQTAAAQTDATGRFIFGRVSTAGTHTVTPAADGLTFSPASQTFANPASNQDTLFLTPPDAPNVIDAAQFFVRQQYRDFFNREADDAGLAFWTSQITSCGANLNCTIAQRENTSGAFYLSIEFQETGFLVYRLTKASFNRAPAFAEFFPDQQRLGASVVVGQGEWEAQLARNRETFIAAWVARPAFRARFDSMSNAQYVDALISNAGLTPAEAGRDALLAALSGGTRSRAGVLRDLVENARFKANERNPAFVQMQYFGYLRRDFDLAGFDFWLQKLVNHGGDFHRAEMVKSFLDSGEYRGRFGR